MQSRIFRKGIASDCTCEHAALVQGFELVVDNNQRGRGLGHRVQRSMDTSTKQRLDFVGTIHAAIGDDTSLNFIEGIISLSYDAFVQ